MKYICIVETASHTFKVGDICDVVYKVSTHSDCHYHITCAYTKSQTIAFDNKHLNIHFKPLRLHKLKRISNKNYRN